MLLHLLIFINQQHFEFCFCIWYFKNFYYKLVLYGDSNILFNSKLSLPKNMDPFVMPLWCALSLSLSSLSSTISLLETSVWSFVFYTACFSWFLIPQEVMYLGAFDHFVGLVLIGLTTRNKKQKHHKVI